MSCDQCCIKLSDCGIMCPDSPVCVPRYLCVEVAVTPPPYTGSCCDRFSFRMAGGRAFDGRGCGWSGGEMCINDSRAYFNLDVRLGVDDAGECLTTVVLNFGDSAAETISFPGHVWEFDYTYENLDTGYVFDISVNKAGMVDNPLWRKTCGDCKCVPCLPVQLTALIQYRKYCSGVGFERIDVVTKFFWDELSHSWIGDDIVIDGETYTLDIYIDCETSCQVSAMFCGFGVIGQSDINGDALSEYGDGCMPLFFPIDGIERFPHVDNPGGHGCLEHSNSATVGNGPIQLYDMPLLDQSYTIYKLNEVPGQPAVEFVTLRLVDSSCGAEDPPEKYSCVGGCRGVGTKSHGSTSGCPLIELTATAIAPGCAYDGASCILRQGDFDANACNNSPDIGASGLEPEACIYWCGHIVYACDGVTLENGGIDIRILLVSGKKTCADLDYHTDTPWIYRLRVEGPGGCGDGLSPDFGKAQTGNRSPSSATCSPFRLDFDYDAPCSGLVSSLPQNHDDPVCVGDTCTTLTIRITR